MNLCIYTCFVYLQPFCVTLDFKLFIDSIHILFLLYLLIWFWDFHIKSLQNFIKISRALIKDIYLSRVNAALKENLEFFVFFKFCGPLAQGTRRSQSKELKFFTKAKIGLQLNQSTPWSGLGRPGATIHPGIVNSMSSRTPTSSSSTWTEEQHQEVQENQEIDQKPR